MATRRPENATWYLALIFIIMASFVVWAVVSLRIDRFTEAAKKDRPISIVMIVDDGLTPIVSEVLLLSPITGNGALVALPRETGALLERVDRVDRLEILYDPSDPKAYIDAVGSLLGIQPDFYLTMSSGNFERLVDHLGGIDVFVPNSVDAIIDGVRYLFPPGGVRLDGAKARLYLEYRPDGELITERTEREHRVFMSLLRSLAASSDRITSDEVLHRITDLVDSNLDSHGLATMFETFASLNTDRLILQGVLGNRRMLDGKDVLFPYYDGKLVKETLQRVLETIEKPGTFSDDIMVVRVEIQNGSGIPGIASRTAQLYQSYGFRIASVGNADRDDYERTVILDRRGNPDAARRVADLIRCEQIHSRIDEKRDETVDVTIILGKDFDGRYVKNERN